MGPFAGRTRPPLPSRGKCRYAFIARAYLDTRDGICFDQGWRAGRPRQGSPPHRECQLDLFAAQGRIALGNLFHAGLQSNHRRYQIDRNPGSAEYRRAAPDFGIGRDHLFHVWINNGSGNVSREFLVRSSDSWRRAYFSIQIVNPLTGREFCTGNNLEPKDTPRHDPPYGSNEHGRNSGVKWPQTANDGLNEMVPGASATFRRLARSARPQIPANHHVN
jgi:hypothetical protein